MAIILFLVSLFGLSMLLGSKIFEIKVKKIHFISNTFMRADKKIHDLIDKAVLKYNRYERIVSIFLFDFIPSYVYEILVRMKDYVSKKYYNAGDGFRGRRVLRSNGSVSFFLERLAEDKADSPIRKI